MVGGKLMLLSGASLEAQSNEDQGTIASGMCWAEGWAHCSPASTLRRGNQITVGRIFQAGGVVPIGGKGQVERGSQGAWGSGRHGVCPGWRGGRRMHRGLELFAKLPLLLPHDFRLNVSLRAWGPHLQTVITRL